MSPLLAMLTPTELNALQYVARACGRRITPSSRLRISRTKRSALGKLGLIDVYRGRIDGELLIRISEVGAKALATLEPCKAEGDK